MKAGYQFPVITQQVYGLFTYVSAETMPKVTLWALGGVETQVHSWN